MRLKATLASVVLLGAWAVPSFAEVQNVRVGGDVTVRGFMRECLDLNCGDDIDQNGVNGSFSDGQDAFIQQTTAVNVGADLTENVSAFIRVTNERDWNADTAVTADVDLSQAYVTLKELFYSPLTLRVGSQPIVWGRGFVLGSNLLPSVGLAGNDRNASITANEFTDLTAFDAIRATLDLSNVAAGMPVNLEYVYIKMDENTTGASDDLNLQGVNLGTRLEDLSAEIEAYFLNKRDKGVAVVANAIDAGATGGPGHHDGSVNTLGFRGSIQPVEGSNVFGEIAYQFGRRATDLEGTLPAGDSQQAWAFNLGAEFALTDVSLSPKVGAEWIFWSGKNVDGARNGWDPIARGYYTTALREFQTNNNAGFYATPQTGDTGGFTNQHQIGLYGSLKPVEDLTIAPRLSFFFLDVGAIPIGADGTVSNKRKRYAGTELDTQVLYNYTEDVQLGLLYGVFAPGSVYRDPNDSLAQELVTTVGVKF